MSEFRKALKNIDGENVDIETKISPLAIQNYDVKKIDINLSNSEVATFNVFENIEIKAIIHDFYKKEQEHINQFTDDEKYRELIFKLYQHLGYKSQFDNFSMAEKILLHLIHTCTDSLIAKFKIVLKEVEQK